MDYKNKYLKYKNKYLYLKKQFGGVQIKYDTVTNPLPASHSWLYMSLIYDHLTDIRIEYQFDISACFTAAIGNYNANRAMVGNPFGLSELPFNNYVDFNTLLLIKLRGLGIEQRAQLIHPYAEPQVEARFREDSLCHINRDSQEEILYYDRGGICPTEFFPILINYIRDHHVGLQIIYHTKP